MPHHHDDHRVRARKMIAPAGRAMAAIAEIGHLALGATSRTKAVGLVPMQKAPRLRQHGEHLRRHLAFHHHAAQRQQLIALSRRAREPQDTLTILAQENLFVRLVQPVVNRAVACKRHLVATALQEALRRHFGNFRECTD